MNNTQTEIDRIFELQRDPANLQRLKNTSVKERLAKIRKVERYLHDNVHRKQLADALYADFRKPEEESLANEFVPFHTSSNHLIRNLKAWLRDQHVESPISMAGMYSMIRYEPKGCVLIMGPWNYPFHLCINPMIYAVAAGNAVTIKPSEFASATSAFIKMMVKDLFMENEVTVIEGGVDDATALLNKPFHHIFFTGSPRVGKIVMQAASNNLASVTLELGGKSPVIIDDTTNIKAAAEKVVWAKTMNCGQTCIAPDYLLIHASKKDEFTKEYKAALSKFYNADGSGIQNSKLFARIINRKNLHRVKELLDDAVSKGAQITVGGEINEDDLYVAPTILERVNSDMLIMQEEIFAPLLPVITFKNMEETTVLINRLPKPLVLYILSNNRKNIDIILNNTSAGSSAINEMMVTSVNPNLPFGGINNSGFGKSNGRYSFINFSNERGIIKRKWGTLKMLYPPYNKTIYKWLIKIARL